MNIEKEKTEVTIENFLSKVKHYYHASDVLRITSAYELAYAAHQGQFRASGRPYITHPVTVADILIDMGLDVSTICAALLHDTVEDTYVTDEDLRKQFGDEIAYMVAGVTKLDRIQFQNKEQEQAENMRKMFFAMAKDVRVMLIKLADRLHNMRSLMHLSEQKQQVIAKETLDIFAPIAGRLGISSVKSELEDLCLKYLDYDAFMHISSGIALKKVERETIVDDFINELKKELRSGKIDNFYIYGRTKHFYSIYKKMKRQNKTLDQVYDLTAVRVIVDTIKDCYSILGSIHARWKPMPGRFKDYIAVPKPNMYQSLHTTVFIDWEGYSYPIEVQIRTHEMHKIAEYGIAAHWKYKEGLSGTATPMDEKLSWVKEVLSYDDDLKDSSEFLDLIRKDISNTNEVYVFTPNGDVKILAAGATALDFAYAVHSQVGNKCVGVKVNNKIVPLETVLSTGDTVEVMTNPNAKGPSRDWLKICTTPSAKSKIRQFFKRELKDEYIRTGKSMIERESKHRGITPSELLTNEAIQNVCERYMFSNADEMYAAVGYGSATLNQIVTRLIACNKSLSDRLKAKQTVKKSTASNRPESAVIIKGVEDLLVRFSRCCSPVPGDEIVGYVSRGRGVCVHRADCPAVKTMEKERLVHAVWANTDGNTAFPATIEIISEDKGDIFADITRTIANEGLPMLAINARKDKRGNAIAVVTVEISNHDQVNQLMNKLHSIPAVINVYRTHG